LYESVWQSVKQCLESCAQQDQGSRKRHEQKVLNHVRRQHFVIERTQRRRDRQQDEEQADHKTAGMPGLDAVEVQPAKAKPSTQVDKGNEN
jgi:hypothetical protein